MNEKTLDELVDKVLKLEPGEQVEYFRDRYCLDRNDPGSEITTMCYFYVKRSPDGTLEELRTAMYKEEIDYAEDMYCMPVFDNPDVLRGVIKAVCEQSHSAIGFSYS
jgi:hypothetical protein